MVEKSYNHIKLSIFKAMQVMFPLTFAAIDLFRLGGFLHHFRPGDDTLENSRFKIFK